MAANAGKITKSQPGEKGTPLPLNVHCSEVSNGVGHSFQLCQMFLGRGKIYNAPPIRKKAGMYISFYREGSRHSSEKTLRVGVVYKHKIKDLLHEPTKAVSRSVFLF